MKPVGKTPEGRIVVSGVFGMVETHGIPLELVLARSWEEGMIPDWVELIDSMVRAGKPMDRAVEAVRVAVSDAGYPPDFRDNVIAGIEARFAK